MWLEKSVDHIFCKETEQRIVVGSSFIVPISDERFGLTMRIGTFFNILAHAEGIQQASGQLTAPRYYGINSVRDQF